MAKDFAKGGIVDIPLGRPVLVKLQVGEIAIGLDGEAWQLIATDKGGRWVRCRALPRMAGALMIEQAAGGTLFLLVAITLAVLVAYAVLEAWMLYNGRRPITQYVRQGVNEHAKVAAAIAFVVGLLAGHLWR